MPLIEIAEQGTGEYFLRPAGILPGSFRGRYRPQAQHRPSAHRSVPSTTRNEGNEQPIFFVLNYVCAKLISPAVVGLKTQEIFFKFNGVEFNGVEPNLMGSNRIFIGTRQLV